MLRAATTCQFIAVMLREFKTAKLHCYLHPRERLDVLGLDPERTPLGKI